jgi:hypothetical protein
LPSASASCEKQASQLLSNAQVHISSRKECGTT